MTSHAITRVDSIKSELRSFRSLTRTCRSGIGGYKERAQAARLSIDRRSNYDLSVGIPSGDRPLTEHLNMPSLLVIFDGDDTLWLVEHLYDEAREAAARIVTEEGFEPSAWEALERRIDVQNVVRFGVSAKRFPTSCVEAYRQLAAEAGRAVVPDVAHRIWKAAASVFERQAAPVHDVDAVLEDLRLDCTLVLLTKGERWVQRKRIADARVEDKFDHVVITPTKGSEEFVDLLIRFRTEPTTMVGREQPRIRHQPSPCPWYERHLDRCPCMGA